MRSEISTDNALNGTWRAGREVPPLSLASDSPFDVVVVLVVRKTLLERRLAEDQLYQNHQYSSENDVQLHRMD